MTEYYAVHQDGLEYVQVETGEEYDQNYGKLHADYRPRCRKFQSRELAEAYAVQQNQRAREKYGAA